MKSFPAPVLTVEYAGLAETNRAILDADGITLEARGVVGGFHPWKRVFWDEVTGVYRWEAPDWGAISLGLGVALIALLLGGLSWALQANLTASLIWGTLGLLSAAAGWWIGARFRPRQWFRLESAATAVQFHTGRSEVWALIRERLEVSTDAVENPPPSAHGGVKHATEGSSGASQTVLLNRKAGQDDTADDDSLHGGDALSG